MRARLRQMAGSLAFHAKHPLSWQSGQGIQTSAERLCGRRDKFVTNHFVVSLYQVKAYRKKIVDNPLVQRWQRALFCHEAKHDLAGVCGNYHPPNHESVNMISFQSLVKTQSLSFFLSIGLSTE